MRIEQLAYVQAVTRHGSLRRASEHLHVSQPALSEAVQKLERELGVPLLDRRRTGARISREGMDLLGHMIGVLDAVDRLRDAAGARRATSTVVRVGTVDAATSSVLVPAVRDFGAREEGCTVEVTVSTQERLDQLLTEGRLDLALVNVVEGDDGPPDLLDTTLLEGGPVLVVPERHRLAAAPPATIDELRDEQFVAMRAGYLMNRILHRLFGVGLPTLAATVDGAEMGKKLVAEGLGVTLLPDYSVAGDPLLRSGALAVQPLPGEPVPLRLLLRRRAVDHVPPGVRGLMTALADHARRHTRQVAREQRALTAGRPSRA